ncbi:hypothetical protein [Blastococcus sp. CCUG 61487]|uniref:hypothetical protein n=1 Tax=Blastococcus sp. CCUG 61487 TaxID=1840703 RepID=UPI0010C043C5|nr:hypothetical protein [Blastococcus sp. CCUG 61487]TKJ29741.1 hypothetical protein A6V29_02145 [Blastococcus sp. CCUG 61487]
MDVIVEVGGWEHECCGDAIERNQLVDFRCIRYRGPDGRARLAESHHDGLDVPAEERVSGRVADIHVVGGPGAARPVLRIPSGRALRGFDDVDDGHLEDPWTGEVIEGEDPAFLVTVRTSGRPARAPRSTRLT